jgi:hypothetical protein
MEGSHVRINLVETLCGLRNEYPVIVNMIPLISVVAVNERAYGSFRPYGQQDGVMILAVR